ncbi:MAG: glycoside hydrolase family 125 protein [Candidatus Nanopelagicales bacterium]
MRQPAGLLTWLAEMTAPLPDRRADLVRAAVARTVERAMRRLPDGTVYVATGDIPAMWLRDSAAQVRPLLPAAAQHPNVADLLVGVARRQLRYIAIDPRANAFNPAANGAGNRDYRNQSPWVWERKYEVDSLAWALDLSNRLWEHGITGHLDADWLTAAELVVGLWALETEHSESDYTFRRLGVPGYDTLGRGGRGAPVGPTGMTWSGFRPSDDACRFGYLIPANAQAAVALEGVAAIASGVFGQAALAGRAAARAAGIRAGIAAHGVVGYGGGAIYAYEVDGLGGATVMDDANVPSLLSLPYLGFCAPDDPLYRATRAFVLSPANPYFAHGRYAHGVGSIHTPRGRVWPLAIALAGLTGTPAEAAEALEMLEATTAGTGRMHESIDPDQPRRFSREWFSWADMTYVELALLTARSGP